MGFFDDLDKTISGIGRKAKDVTDSARLQNSINGLEKEKRDLLLELGRSCYEKYKQRVDNSGSIDKSLCSQIEEKERQILEYSKQIQRVKGVVVCPDCHAELPLNSQFCNKCGAKIPGESGALEDMQEKATARFCNVCGAVLEENQRFCVSCGTDLKSFWETGPDETEMPPEGQPQDTDELSDRREVKTPDKNEVLTCPDCGAEIMENMRFCIICGKKLP